MKSQQRYAEDLGNGCKLVRFEEVCGGKSSTYNSSSQCVVRTPRGFKAKLYAEVPGARQIAISLKHGAQDLYEEDGSARVRVSGSAPMPPPPWIVYVGTAAPFYAWGAKLGRTKGYTGRKKLTQENKVWALVDLDGDGRVDQSTAVIGPEDMITRPMGVAWHNNFLYVTVGGLKEPTRVRKVGPGVDEYALAGVPFLRSGGKANLPVMEMREAVSPSMLPSDQATAVHNWKHVFIHPFNDKMYLPVGAPCNVCNETHTLDRYKHPLFNPPQSDVAKDPSLGLLADSNHATILEFDLNRNELGKPVARGVRNSLGIDWHPDTGDMWVTNNGRDLMGDNTPECTVHRIPKHTLEAHAHYHAGFPVCHTTMRDPNEDPIDRCQKDETGCTNPLEWLPDDVFSNGHTCRGEHFIPASIALGPHNAPLGAAFYDWQRVKGRPSAFPSSYDRALFVAEHGSWNRSPPTGYRVSVSFIDGEKVRQGKH